MRSQTQFPNKLSNQALDEMLAPIAALIEDPLACSTETDRIMARLAYLVGRGPARDGRAEFLKSMAVSGIQLFLEDVEHDSGAGEPNWWRLAQLFNVTPKEARDLFPNWSKL